MTNKEVITAYQRRVFLKKCLKTAKEACRRAANRIDHLSEKIRITESVDEIFEGVALHKGYSGNILSVAYCPRVGRVWQNVNQEGVCGVELELDMGGFSNRKRVFSSSHFGTREDAELAVKRWIVHNEKIASPTLREV
jgi:hypothetical protein